MSNNPLVKDIYSNRSDVLAIADDANVTLHQVYQHAYEDVFKVTSYYYSMFL